ncbi:MAG: GntR family transcriptional regulator [Parasporobacterium sp.]|nr:GntR family transcriptional regulator [Parasporobacterium sp.]
MSTPRKSSVSSDVICKDLLKRIIHLEYEPGEGISENELCEVYGATRHAIRGALAVLREKGLVEVFPQRGTYVSLIDLKMIDNILFLREALEQETIHEIMKSGDHTELVRKLRECLEKQKSVDMSEDNAALFYELDEEFHRLLLKEIGRESVLDLYADSYLHVIRWRNMEVTALQRFSYLPEEHKNIIDAIENNDEHKARVLLGKHIDSVAQFGMEMKEKYPRFFV